MAATRTVIIGAGESLRDVVVREITVGEVRDWLIDVESGNGQADLVTGTVWPDFGLDDLARMCNASVADLEAYIPSERETLVVACKELNPHFFRPRAAVAKVARAMQAELQRTQSTAAAAH